jgi:hypothetical protein
MKGITDAVSSSALGPYYVGVAVANAVKSVNTSCKGYTKEFADEVAKVKQSENKRENAFMQNYFGKRPPGTWESLSCDQLSQIRLCQGYDAAQKAGDCKTAFGLKSEAEELFSQSVFSKTSRTSNSGPF